MFICSLNQNQTTTTSTIIIIAATKLKHHLKAINSDHRILFEDLINIINDYLLQLAGFPAPILIKIDGLTILTRIFISTSLQRGYSLQPSTTLPPSFISIFRINIGFRVHVSWLLENKQQYD